ncbi:hypothetical protein KFE25_008440 [Diacronema lutheri]|uniref:Peptidase S49 domain-containing protein n=3 Tax=Diacronema lutheri TaxID=2081491 RepID=A0A8J5X3S1_DIALT|nr:hypothetical protein KFE25_008440 [Diacronema lutheri]
MGPMVVLAAIALVGPGAARVGRARAPSLVRAPVSMVFPAKSALLLADAAKEVAQVPARFGWVPRLDPALSAAIGQLTFQAVQEFIRWAIPGAVIALIFAAIGGFRRNDSDSDGPIQLLGRRNEVNELLKVDVLDARLESYDYSFTKAEISPQEALRRKQLAELSRIFGALGDLDVAQLQRLRKADNRLRARSARSARRVAQLLPQLRALSVDAGAEDAEGDAKDDGAEEEKAAPDEEQRAAVDGAIDGDEGGAKGQRKSFLSSFWPSSELDTVSEELTRLSVEAVQIESDFVRELSEILTPPQRRKLRQLLERPTRAGRSRGLIQRLSGAEGSSAAWTDGTVDAISPLYRLERASGAGGAQPGSAAPAAGAGGGAPAARAPPPRVYVLTFDGDTLASQVSSLREEVTGVLRSASPGDEVVLKLNTGGGTVTGYGLAASQLERIKAAGLTLTVCVEQVAASGGYLMACVASPGRLFAPPFAVLGSIGVISEQPNVYRRLQKEGIEFVTVTAGKFKRTLTPFKKVAQKDFDKRKDDIEQVLYLFKMYVARHRPQLNIDEVATGETWFGPDALKRNLIDALATSDDVILQLSRDPATRVYSVKYQPRSANPLLAAFGGAEDARGASSGGVRGLFGALVGALARAVASELSTTVVVDEYARGAGARLDAGGASSPSARLYAEQVLARSSDSSAMLR